MATALLASAKEKPTVGNTLRAWLSQAESTHSPEQLRSARNFARAFSIWFNKANQPATCETSELASVQLEVEIDMFTDDFAVITDPTLEPSSKIKNIATNAKSYMAFLGEHGLLPENEVTDATLAFTHMDETLQRTQRATWVLFQRENWFHPNLLGQPMSVVVEGEEIEALYEIVALKDNFVLVETRGADLDGTPVAAPDDPIKIQVPSVVAKLLRVGDSLHAGIQKAEKSDYWVITSILGVEPASRAFWLLSSGADTTDLVSSVNNLSINQTPEEASRIEQQVQKDSKTYDDVLRSIRTESGYVRRKEERLESASPPSDGFPEDKYTEAWFAEREHDLDSDEEPGELWDDLSDGEE